MQQILGIWLLATVGFVVCAFIWVFVPVLVPVLGLTAAMAVLVAAIVGAARALQRLRGEPHDPNEPFP